MQHDPRSPHTAEGRRGRHTSGRPTRLGRWLAVVAIVVVAAAAVWTYRLVTDDEPEWCEAGPDELAALLASMPDETRWDLAMVAGQEHGEYCETDLATLVVYADALPPALREYLYDGYGHGRAWDTDRADEAMTEVLRTIPADYQPLLFRGVLIDHVVACGGDAAEVLPFARRMERSYGMDPQDGVRIGLQHAHPRRVGRAIELARDYPTSWWSAIYEELGWRAAWNHPGEPARWLALADDVPDEARCHFVHGAVRCASDGIEEDPIDLQVLLDAPGDLCREAALRGVAVNLDRFSGDADELEARLRDELRPADAEAVLQAYRAMREPGDTSYRMSNDPERPDAQRSR